MTITISDMKLEELSLEPQEPAAAEPTTKGPAQFKIDTRSGNDRRCGTDRRQSIRFEADRRQGSRRATGGPWTSGSY